MKVVQRTRKQVFKLWIKALRSGDYRQSTGCLREATLPQAGFCCLGVLQDLAAKDGGPQWDGDHIEDPWGQDGEPTTNISDFMGLNVNELRHLINMNDDDKYSFSEIADVIESEIMPALV